MQIVCYDVWGTGSMELLGQAASCTGAARRLASASRPGAVTEKDRFAALGVGGVHDEDVSLAFGARPRT